MDAKPFSLILKEIADADLERFRPDEMLSWLARLIREHTGVAGLTFCGALNTPGQVYPDGDAEVFSGASEDKRRWLFKHAREVCIGGRSPDLENGTEVIHDFFTGPCDEPGIRLSAGERGLLIRVKLLNAMCWALVVADGTLDEPECRESWIQAMLAFLSTVVCCINPEMPHSVRGYRHRFYQSLLTHAPIDLEHDCKLVCRAWLEVTGADWVWLWLYNQQYTEFELVQFAASDPDQERNRSVLPPARTKCHAETIAMYCGMARTPVFTTELFKWTGTLDAKNYRILTANLLTELGCIGVECVPLLRATDESSRKICGAVTLHYRDLHRRNRHPDIALVSMGRCTASCIQHALDLKQRRVLVDLNAIAQEHLTQPSGDPEQIRKRYLKDLIRLIKKELDVEGVSIFWRVGQAEEVQCLASTGLTTTTGDRIREDEFTNVRYKLGEGLTGGCYERSELILESYPTRARGHLGKFKERREKEPKSEFNPIVLCPIGSPGESGDPGSNRALGVIRCTENHSPMFPDEVCNFDPTEVETLRFIANQIGPVLQTFSQRVAREKAISIVKHDLFAPLRMICDTVYKMIRAQKQKLAYGAYDLRDIQVSVNFALNLAKQLDPKQEAQLPDASTDPQLQTEWSNLEGDIVARIKGMLMPYAREQNKMTIRFDGLDNIPRLFVDQELIERAFNNLIMNAIKYGAPGTEIKIYTDPLESEDNFYEVHVRNEGVGVHTKDADHIFELGYRAEQARSLSPDGEGLGLPIARQAMRAHGGDLILTQNQNPTIFTLLFPITLHFRRPNT